MDLGSDLVYGGLLLFVYFLIARFAFRFPFSVLSFMDFCVWSWRGVLVFLFGYTDYGTLVCET